jgi:1-acyl-sn-glycerol-3-phosphate acyltransferase
MIEKWSLGYWLVRPYFSFCFRLFHREIVILGKENIPENKPVIYAPNHPNALHDDLAIVYSVPQQVVWMGRADLFKSAIARPFLRFLKIIPVYRIRDGKESLGLNENSFRIAIKALQSNKAVGLYPEAENSFNRRMRLPKKAIPRIVFLGGEMTGYSLDTQIIPTGIFFDQPHNFGRRLLIQFGKPIRAKEYYEAYRENPYKATTSLRDTLHEALLPLILNYNSTKNVNGFESVRRLGTPFLLHTRGLPDTLYNRFITGRKLSQKCDGWEDREPETAHEFGLKALHFEESLKGYGIRNWVVDHNQESWLKCIPEITVLTLTSPLFLFGLTFNAIPFFTIDRIVRKKVKQEIFRSTFSFGLGFLAFPMMYLIEMLMVSPVLSTWYWRVLFLVSLPLTGKIAHNWYIRFLKTRGRFRWMHLKRSDPDTYLNIHREKQQIIDQVKQLFTS